MDLSGVKLGWLTGPIFDKEMRVSSRRRRNYVLRFLYIGLFTFLVTVLWVDRVAHTTSSGYTSVYQVSRMSSVGMALVAGVLWFQFLTTQMIAVVMLSTSISDEIYKRTLGALMTTPIGSFQIVIGKLTSKLLQIVLLLAISLPLLAIVRVFGGVPWGFLLSGLCVTLTAVLFVGSLSLFFSIFTRRAYAAIIQTILTMGLLFGFLPVILIILTSPKGPSPALLQGLSYGNPFMVMGAAMESLYSARPGLFVVWPLHCATMFGVSALLLLVAMIFVRKAALRQAVGATPRGCLDSSGPARGPAVTSIRRVQGPPVLWKERRIPLLGKQRKVAKIITAIVGLGLLLLTYGLCLREGVLGDKEVHVMYAIVFFSLGLLWTMVLPATCITTERESQTWTLLLATPVGNWEILWSKLAGAVRRCLPAWLFLFGHVIVFAGGGIIHPIALVQLGLLVAWVLFFLASTGLYFSLRFKHTTTAVIVNMALAAGLWAIVPLFLAILLGLAKMQKDALNVYMDMNPFVHAVAVVLAAAHQGGLGSYDWVQGGMKSWVDATGWMVLTFTVYASVGFLFLALAAWRLRRNPL